MAEPRTRSLAGKRLLVVEDDYMIASELARALEEHGVEVIGPVGCVADALALLGGAALDGAVLDINLGRELAYPVAEALRQRGVPFVFATGYDAWLIPEPFESVPRCEKPVDMRALARLL